MRILVCGSRDWDDFGYFKSAVAANLLGWRSLAGDDPDFVIIEGGARGADAAAAEFAHTWCCDHDQFTADWENFGKAAGPIRNQQMLDEGTPDLVLAFVNKPLAESRGTADMVSRAIKAGVPVYVVEAIA